MVSLADVDLAITLRALADLPAGSVGPHQEVARIVIANAITHSEIPRIFENRWKGTVALSSLFVDQTDEPGLNRRVARCSCG